MQNVVESFTQALQAVVASAQLYDTRTGEVSAMPADASPRMLCAWLEQGGVVVFPQSPLPLPHADRVFLLNQEQSRSTQFKNVAYKPAQDRLTGAQSASAPDQARLKQILQGYSESSFALLQQCLAPYGDHMRREYTTFRPVEEQGRKLRLRARNDLLHVDSFPTRPIYGQRILRFFTNINPEQPRVWKTSEPFDVLARQYHQAMRPPRGEMRQSPPSRVSLYSRMARLLGLKQAGLSAYDGWMTDFHNFLKENTTFQTQSRQDTWAFPPGSSWMVYTDVVSHAVLSGRFALEQTLLVGLDGMVTPELAPFNQLLQLYPPSASS